MRAIQESLAHSNAPSGEPSEDEQLAHATQESLSMAETAANHGGTATSAESGALGESHEWILCPDISEEALQDGGPPVGTEATSYMYDGNC